MTLKEVPQAAGGPFVFNVKGTIEVAGAAKEFEFPVQMTVDPTNSKVLTFAGEVAAKMTDFGIEPVSALAGTIKTGDEIKLGISWVVQEAVKR
jgi:polyisoprenoid-binding protein YceI